MKVQTLERTFIDKVFAVCDYRIQNMLIFSVIHMKRLMVYNVQKMFPQRSFREILVLTGYQDRKELYH